MKMKKNEALLQASIEIRLDPMRQPSWSAWKKSNLLQTKGMSVGWRGAGETVKVLAGVAGIALGFVLNFALKSKTRDYPEITRIIAKKTFS